MPSLFEDRSTSWVKIVSGVEQYVREAMPIHEGQETSGKPAAKAKSILKPASTSNPNFIPMTDRRWFDIEVQKAKDQSCHQMSKFIANLLRHREDGREKMPEFLMLKFLSNAKKNCQRIQDIGQTK